MGIVVLYWYCGRKYRSAAGNSRYYVKMTLVNEAVCILRNKKIFLWVAETKEILCRWTCLVTEPCISENQWEHHRKGKYNPKIMLILPNQKHVCVAIIHRDF
jgi:hypothetical protein